MEIDSNGVSEPPTAVQGQTLPAPAEAGRRFPSLRPFWGRLLRARTFDIRPARTADQQGLINMLIRRVCAWRGPSGESLRPRLDDPNRVTLAAWQFDEVVATLTLDRDSPAGLSTDARYAPELAGLRRPDRVLCEVSKLAVDPDFSSPALLTNLFETAVHYAKDVLSASDAVIEVNPRLAGYYQRRLGFRQIGQLRSCTSVGSPRILLHRPLHEMSIARAYSEAAK